MSHQNKRQWESAEKPSRRKKTQANEIVFHVLPYWSGLREMRISWSTKMTLSERMWHHYIHYGNHYRGHCQAWESIDEHRIDYDRWMHWLMRSDWLLRNNCARQNIQSAIGKQVPMVVFETMSRFLLINDPHQIVITPLIIYYYRSMNAPINPET